MTEVFEGFGILYEGPQRLGEAHYRVERTAPALRGGVWRMRGQIGEGDLDLNRLFLRPDTPVLTLHLEDGMRWDCRLSSPQGTLSPVGSGFYRMENGVRVEVPN
jgi:hypothetical protein